MYSRQAVNRHVGPERASQEKYDRFERWLRENGALFDMVRCCLLSSQSGHLGTFLRDFLQNVPLTRVRLVVFWVSSVF